MSTNTLARASTFAIGVGTDFEPVKFTKDNGALVLQRVPVFRSGTFRDSTGVQMTYDKLHMNQIMTNWNHLRDNALFRDVPVRNGHANWLLGPLPGAGNVIGWHTNLATEDLPSPVDGVTYSYLLVDYEITDPPAQVQVNNGTFRSRSAEIGSYVTNNEAEYWPVYMGFAYVDIPAVEGLQFSRDPNGPKFFFLNTKETGVTSPTTAPGQTPPALLNVPTPPQTYSMNGLQTTDPVAVQNHINTLEQFRTDTTAANRSDFVTGLARDNKIMATQVDSLTAFAQGLTPEQFANWQATYALAPVQPVLGQHGQTVTNPNNSAQLGTQAQTEAELMIAADTVKQHQRAGTPVDKIKLTASYKKLEAAGKAPAL